MSSPAVLRPLAPATKQPSSDTPTTAEIRSRKVGHRASVQWVLDQPRPVTLAEALLGTGLSMKTVERAMNDAIRMGVLTREQVGRIVVYRPNSPQGVC